MGVNNEKNEVFYFLLTFISLLGLLECLIHLKVAAVGIQSTYSFDINSCTW